MLCICNTLKFESVKQNNASVSLLQMSILNTTTVQQLNSDIVKMSSPWRLLNQRWNWVSRSRVTGAPSQWFGSGRVRVYPVLSFSIMRLLFLQSNNISANKMIVVAMCCKTRVFVLFVSVPITTLPVYLLTCLLFWDRGMSRRFQIW